MIEPMAGIFDASPGPCFQLYVTLHNNTRHYDVSLEWLRDANKSLINSGPDTDPSCRAVIPNFAHMMCSTPLELQGKSLMEAGVNSRNVYKNMSSEQYVYFPFAPHVS